MKKYELFLFDADGTLYDYDMAEANALKSMFEQCGFAYDDQTRMRYRAINQAVWDRFEKGELSKEILQVLRFERLFAEVGVEYDAKAFNEKYLFELGKGAFLMEGALEICQEIAAACKQIFIVTNGILATQEARIKHSLIKDYISASFVSEHIGFQKPDMRYFEHVFANIPQINKEKILLVGDSLSADIAGGNQAGLDTCWFNESRAENQTNIKPTYEINSLKELRQFI